jgi:hypothetical protein
MRPAGESERARALSSFDLQDAEARSLAFAVQARTEPSRPGGADLRN